MRAKAHLVCVLELLLVLIGALRRFPQEHLPVLEGQVAALLVSSRAGSALQPRAGRLRSGQLTLS